MKKVKITAIRKVQYDVEKPRAFDPRGQVSLTLRDKIRLTLCGQIRLTPENFAFSGAFL